MSVNAVNISSRKLLVLFVLGAALLPCAQALTVVAVMRSGGVQGDFDTPNLRGAQLAVADFNARGGFKGEKLTLKVVGPDGPWNTVGVSAYLLGPSLNSAEVLKIATATRSSGAALVLSGQGGANLLPSLGGRGILAGFGDNAQAAAAAQFALKRGWKSLLVVSQPERRQSQDLARYFRDTFHMAGGGMLLNQSYGAGGNDLSDPEVSRRLRATLGSVDALYLAVGADDASGLVRDLRAGGVTLPILGPDRLEFSLPGNLNPAQLGELYSTVHTLIPSNASGPLKRLMDRYTTTYKTPLKSSFTVVGYDALNLITGAVSSANSAKPAAVLSALNALKAVPVTVGTLIFKPGSRVPSTNMTVVRLNSTGPTLASAEALAYIPAP